MLIKRRFGWEIPEHKVTPEAVFLNRRAVLSGLAGAAMTGLAGPALAEGDPSQGLYPAPLNPAGPGRNSPVTAEPQGNRSRQASHRDHFLPSAITPIAR